MLCHCPVTLQMADSGESHSDTGISQEGSCEGPSVAEHSDHLCHLFCL